MACNEDCDQILLAGNKTSDEGWRENGESSNLNQSWLVNRCQNQPDSFHDDDGEGLPGVWQEEETMANRGVDR